MVDFKSKEDYDDLEKTFIRIYKNPEYHEGGLYRSSLAGISNAE